MCVAIQILYCRQLAGKVVSRYKICIVIEVVSLAGIRLQYKYCIVTDLRGKGWTVLQYNTASPGHGQPALGTVPAIRSGWRVASTHDTAARATTRRWGAYDTALGHRAWRAVHSAQGRACERCDTAAWAAIRSGASATTQPGPATIRPGLRTPWRAWVPNWASLGA